MQITRFLKRLVIGLVMMTLAGVAGWGADAPGMQLPAGGLTYRVYVGTYTGPKSKGIYQFQMSLTKGTLTPLGVAAETENPSFLALDPTGQYLYAANETSQFEGKPGGGVTAFAIASDTGKLTLLNHQSSGGASPCHIILDNTGKYALVANYGSGNASVFPIEKNGKLGESSAYVQHAGSSVNKQRQEGPHAHCMTLDAANRFAFICDLGLDQVRIYQFNPAEEGLLMPRTPAWIELKPGSGPRHMTFHPEGHFAYVINELNSTITVFEYNATLGTLKEQQTVTTLPGDFKGENTTAEVEVHPTGKYLYGSNRGHDSLAVYAIDPVKGTLTLIEHQSSRGKGPRNFAIDPTGNYLIAANQGSDSLVVFKVDTRTGRLTPTGQTFEVGAPVCVKFLSVR